METVWSLSRPEKLGGAGWRALRARGWRRELSRGLGAARQSGRRGAALVGAFPAQYDGRQKLEAAMGAYSLAQAQEQVDRLIDEALTGEIALTRDGRPVVTLTPTPPEPKPLADEYLRGMRRTCARPPQPRRGFRHASPRDARRRAVSFSLDTSFLVSILFVATINLT